MTELTTHWLGLELRSPLVLAASPLSKSPKAVAAAVAAGASAVIMHSLFEEQFLRQQLAAHWFFEARAKRDAEAFGLPRPPAFDFDASSYLKELETLRELVDVPIFASLNGTLPGPWLDHAKALEAAGASGIEVNLYEAMTSPDESGEQLEQRQVDVVRIVAKQVDIPVTVKLMPFYSSLPSFVRKLEKAGAEGVAVFNRSYEPATHPLEFADESLLLSKSDELPLRLQALSFLHASTQLALACTGGVHTGLDAARAILAGATVIQVASALLERGPDYVGVIQAELSKWLEVNGYGSINAARGARSMGRFIQPDALQRLGYANRLESWHVPKPTPGE